MTRGYGIPTPNASSRFLTSPGFTPEKAIRIRTSPALGCGSSMLPTTNTSRAAPCFSYQAAFIRSDHTRKLALERNVPTFLHSVPSPENGPSPFSAGNGCSRLSLFWRRALVLLSRSFDWPLQADSSRVAGGRLADETANVFSEFGIIFTQVCIQVVELSALKSPACSALNEYPRCAIAQAMCWRVRSVSFYVAGRTSTGEYRTV